MNCSPRTDETTTKAALRAEIKRRKAACSTDERERFSASIIQQLSALPEWKAAHTVLLYHSLPDEVGTHEFIRFASTEKVVLLPVVVGDDLELRRYTPDTEMTNGSFRIQEPTGAAFTDYESIELVVVPGVAFTQQGARLGRGKGYYDRLLPRLHRATKIGICWPFQLVDNIPTEKHDILMDKVLS